MRVLAVSSYGALGGGELSLAEFLAHRPARVDALALLVEDGPLRAHLLERGVSTWAADGYDGRPSMLQLARFTRSLQALLASSSPDVVWATGLKAAYLAVPACRLARIPLVWHKVDFSLDAVLARPLATAVDGVVSVSEAVAAPLGQWLRKRRLLAVVGPPVRLPRELQITPNEREPTIGTLATLSPIKGHHHIIAAAAILAEEFPHLHVLLAGGPSPDHPDYPDQLRQMAERLKISERLELTGFVEDVTTVLPRLSVFVNATYRDSRGFGREGLSGAMLEASWAGLPVVATREGGTPEGLRDGITGSLVDPADPGAIARAAAPFLRDVALARETGSAGRRFARERFDPEVGAARLFAALESVA
jgi:glycosyltransferase involved in cell wall biosynthesis